MSFFKKIFSKEKKEILDKGLEKSKSSFLTKLSKAMRWADVSPSSKKRVSDDTYTELVKKKNCDLYSNDDDNQISQYLVQEMLRTGDGTTCY